MLQDIAPHKFNGSYKESKVKADDFIVIFSERSVAVGKSCNGDISFPCYRDLSDSFQNDNMRFLFSVDDKDYYLYDFADIPNLPQDFYMLSLDDVRKMKYASFKEMYFLICTAWHLYSWYCDNRWCGRCGQRLTHNNTERFLFCSRCENTVYPRISPAVIVCVTDGERIIMSKYAGRSYKGYALLSGFVEIGETLENAVEREVMEEVGVKVKNIRFYKSQPGGIDGNILAGFYCDLDGDDTLTVDTNELAFARWFRRDEIPVSDDGFSLTFEMIEKWKNSYTGSWLTGR